MSPKASTRSTFSRLLILLLSSIVFCLFWPLNTLGSTTWTITLDGTGSGPKPGYKVDPPSGGCPSQVQDPENLHICQGDAVVWVAVTTGGDVTKMRHKLSIFLEHWILDDNNSDPTRDFESINGNNTLGGATDSKAPTGVAHKYHVSLYDRLTHIEYYDDPTIMIGGKGLLGEVEVVLADCPKFQTEIDQDSIVDEQKKKKAKADAANACEAFQRLKDLLVKQPQK
jgi:hypothetical protein